MNKIKIAFVGAGFNGQLIHISNYYKIKKCELIAIAEPRPILRNLVAKKYKIKYQYSNHLDLINNQKDLDAVVIVTKRQMIAPIAYDFLKNNISIFTEKPIAGNLEQTKKLYNLWKSKNIIYKLGYNKKFDIGILEAKKYFDKFIANNKLGKIVLVKSHRSSGTGYSNIKGDIKTKEPNEYSLREWESKPKWLPLKFKKLYDEYLNLYCHNLNLIRYFCGEIKNVKFSNLSKDIMSTVIMNNGVYDIILETGFFDRDVWDETFEVYFEKGSLKIILPPQHKKNGFAKLLIKSPRLHKNIKIKKPKKPIWSFYYQAKFFTDIVKSKDINNTFNSPEDALGDMLLLEKIWKKYLGL
jgi:predicted dehydrogenase